MKQNKSDYKGVLEFAKSLNIGADYDYSLYGSYDLTSSNLSCRLSAEEKRLGKTYSTEKQHPWLSSNR